MASPLSDDERDQVLRWLRFTIEGLPVPSARKARAPQETFGQRLARLRKARGLSQTALGKRIGISQRMVAYYEVESDRPPAHLLPALAKALSVSIDDLMAAGHLPSEPVEVDVRVWRRFQRLQALPPDAKTTVLKILDSLLDRYGTPDQEAER
jgi:transcriptional regulator with XRE-family HTH domain